MKNKKELFTDMSTAYWLSCQSVHRLVLLGHGISRWQEETLTEILVGHLSGVNYTVEADCPTCDPSPEVSASGCEEWATNDRFELRGSRVQLLNKSQEGGTGEGSVGVGADFLFAIEDFGTGEQVRLLIQAKKIRSESGALQPLKWEEFLRKKKKKDSSTQIDQLESAMSTYGAAAYYLFYPEKSDAHQSFSIVCRRHRTAVGTAAVLVHVDDVKRVFNGEKTADAHEMLAVGRSLLCLGERATGIPENRDFEAVLNFIREGQPGYDPCPAATPTGGYRRVTNTNEKSTVRSRRSVAVSAISPLPLGKHDILTLHLGDWTDSQPGDSDRDGYGWYAGITPDQLRESTRRYWPVARYRAAGIRYLVALRRGEALAVYQVVADPIRHADSKKFEFIVKDLALDDPLAQQIMERAQANYQKQRPHGNSFAYP